MLVCQALLRLAAHMAGCREPDVAEDTRREIADLFFDAPGGQHPLSIHALLRAGAGASGEALPPGRWLRPGEVCAAARSCLNRSRPLGLRCYVAPPLGGAPCIARSQIVTAATSACVDPREDEGGRGAEQVEDEGAEAGDAGRSASEFELVDADMAGGGVMRGQAGDGGAGGEARAVPWQPLLLLVPMMLGARGVSEAYLSQVESLLHLRQSVGIVGGLPQRSLYLFGARGGALLCLDPHTPQAAVRASDSMASYRPMRVGAVAPAQLDASMAAGFLLADEADLEELCAGIEKLEARSGGYPIISVAEHGYDEAGWQARAARRSEGEGRDRQRRPRDGEDGGWELL
ncbi:unnamed protein product [Pedinophyceae sp. YPF-701]|nr:unnamed protein product [Pedinophyceae sp. YPF-701]